MAQSLVQSVIAAMRTSIIGKCFGKSIPSSTPNPVRETLVDTFFDSAPSLKGVVVIPAKQREVPKMNQRAEEIFLLGMSLGYNIAKELKLTEIPDAEQTAALVIVLRDLAKIDPLDTTLFTSGIGGGILDWVEKRFE